MNKETSAKEYCSWEEVDILTKTIAQKIRNSNKKYDAILGITNGGIIPTRALAKELEINDIQFIPFKNKKLYAKVMPILSKDKKYLIVDEIYDTGETLSKVDNVLKKFDYDFAFYHEPQVVHLNFLVPLFIFLPVFQACCSILLETVSK
jgi:uncharacterized protein